MSEKNRKHDAEELKEWQALPLNVKVLMTGARIRAWINEYGEDGVYISFSGGKDSTVLSHLVDRFYPGNKIPRVFVNTGLEYPEIVKFVERERERLVVLRPKMNFKKVVETYGYPFITKEVSKRVSEYRNAERLGKDVTTTCAYREFNGIRGFDGYEESLYEKKKWKFLLSAPFKISNKCCDVMKKQSLKEMSGKMPITGMMADESMSRKKNWFKYGCNAFEATRPISNPMAFWKENDVLQYIKENNVEISEVYGDVVADTRDDLVADGQMRIEDYCGGQCKYRTTGVQRTGCMFCGYGAHREKPGEGRFLRMKQTHPKLYEWIMKPWSEGGLGYKEVIDWINENGGTHIEY